MYVLAPVSHGGMLKSPTMQVIISLHSFFLTYFAAPLLGTYMISMITSSWRKGPLLCLLLHTQNFPGKTNKDGNSSSLREGAGLLRGPRRFTPNSFIPFEFYFTGMYNSTQTAISKFVHVYFIYPENFRTSICLLVPMPPPPTSSSPCPHPHPKA